jgi:hypothetical protein
LHRLVNSCEKTVGATSLEAVAAGSSRYIGFSMLAHTPELPLCVRMPLFASASSSAREIDVGKLFVSGTLSSFSLYDGTDGAGHYQVVFKATNGRFYYYPDCNRAVVASDEFNLATMSRVLSRVNFVLYKVVSVGEIEDAAPPTSLPLYYNPPVRGAATTSSELVPVVRPCGTRGPVLFVGSAFQATSDIISAHRIELVVTADFTVSESECISGVCYEPLDFLPGEVRPVDLGEWDHAIGELFTNRPELLALIMGFERVMIACMTPNLAL